MPGGNGTGPMGTGAMTGRAAGLCAGSAMPGYGNKRQGRGCRRGHRYQFYATGVPGRMWSGRNVAPDKEPAQGEEKNNLRNKADALQTELNLLRSRLDEIEP